MHIHRGQVVKVVQTASTDNTNQDFSVNMDSRQIESLTILVLRHFVYLRHSYGPL